MSSVYISELEARVVNVFLKSKGKQVTNCTIREKTGYSVFRVSSICRRLLNNYSVLTKHGRGVHSLKSKVDFIVYPGAYGNLEAIWKHKLYENRIISSSIDDFVVSYPLSNYNYKTYLEFCSRNDLIVSTKTEFDKRISKIKGK